MLPRLVPRHVAEEVLAEVFELRSDYSEVEEEHPAVVGGALLAVLARLFGARALRGLGLGGYHQGEDRGEFCVACMGRSIIGPDFDRSRGPHVVEVDGAVPRPVVVERIRGGYDFKSARLFMRRKGIHHPFPLQLFCNKTLDLFAFSGEKGE